MARPNVQALLSRAGRSLCSSRLLLTPSEEACSDLRSIASPLTGIAGQQSNIYAYRYTGSNDRIDSMRLPSPAPQCYCYCYCYCYCHRYCYCYW